MSQFKFLLNNNTKSFYEKDWSTWNASSTLLSPQDQLKFYTKPFIKSSYVVPQKKALESKDNSAPEAQNQNLLPKNDILIMTGRQDMAPVASVKSENIHNELVGFQVQNDFKKQDIDKSLRRSTVLQKPSRPAIELYSAKKLISGKNGTKVHFAEGSMPKRLSPPPSNILPCELKSALKRSKSFTVDDSRELENMGFEQSAFPLKYHGLIRHAVLDPNSLSCQKLMELVRLICCKAVESTQYSSPAAQLCFSIIEKEHDHTFLEGLQNSLREWFKERDNLLRISPFSGSVPGSLRRWAAYVSFLTELFSHVKNLVSSHLQGARVLTPHPNSPMAHLALTLQTLLYECAHIILKPPSLNSEEVETLRHMLSSIGIQLEADFPQRMVQLVNNLRDAFIHPSVSTQTRKTLLEMIELHASNWEMNLSQTLYYFPYTRL